MTVDVVVGMYAPVARGKVISKCGRGRRKGKLKEVGGGGKQKGRRSEGIKRNRIGRI